MAQRDDDATDLFAAAPLPVAPLDDDQRLACLRLIRSDNIGPVSFRELINHFGGATEALDAIPEMVARSGNRRSIRLCPKDRAEAELEAADRAGMRPLFTIEPGFPPLLARIDAPPPMIYAKGRIELLLSPIIALVGSRQSSAAGQAFARQTARSLGEAGVMVASGLARGIDAEAHRASLATGTIAVLAGGVDSIYPPENADLHAEIGECGCLISEQPPGFQPRAQDFPRRNRIIAGISHAVVVIEAARRSGSLITARLAGELGREVFAVPGSPLDPRAEGTNQLLKDGATIATCAADILEAMAPQLAGRGQPGVDLDEAPASRFVPPSNVEVRPPGIAAAPTGDGHERVLAVLGPTPVSFDELSRASGLSARHTRIVLLELQLAGEIELHGHDLVSRRPAG